MQPSADNQVKTSAPLAVRDAFKCVHGNVAAVAIVSALLLIPCFWHSHIQAGDLGSHVYNAWLAQLAENGQAPGIVVVRQWNNVLFDFALDYGARLMGWHAAER